MIQYALKCAKGHTFDSWFQSASAYDRLAKAGMVECSVCGGTDVNKAVMTPRVGTSRADAPPAPRKLSEPASPAEQAMAELRRKIEANADYVGRDFAREARAMHEGETPERAIFGEAAVGEARKLVEDGIPVTPLPFLPNRKTN
ncbi:MAG: DUF1178 family protein [Pseudomonadota bacterium]|nr:DUF1178 family protein [Pseudomonadota bacterium]